MEGISAGRSDYTAALVDLGFADVKYSALQESWEMEASPGGLDEFSGNARVVKAALSAGGFQNLKSQAVLLCSLSSKAT